MHAKLINGSLKAVYNAIQCNGNTVINPSEDILLELGYLPVQYTDPPTVDDGYYAAPRWVQTENAIVQEWKILPDTNPLSADEVLRLALRAQVNSLNIPEATASRMVDYYPTMTGDGSLVKAGTRICWGGTLKRAAVDLWDNAENTPDAAPTLWEDIDYRDGIRIIPETITAGLAFAKGEQGWWGDVLYASTMDANVYTPEQYPAGWEVITG